MEEKDRGSFTGRIGFVLATAGASVGLGNIWRFPYLCAKYGGGIFLIVYIVLAVTFGYTMIIAETALGRSTGKSPVGAFNSYTDSRIMKGGGWLNAIVPMLIAPYYCVIGGWVCKYVYEYLKNDINEIASDDFFVNFISDGSSTEFWFIVFTIAVIAVILLGVQNGIEMVSKFVMPVLVLMAIVICVYCVTRPGALKGVKYILVPNFGDFSIMTVVSAMGQMFYSLSIAMGILVTFGSYVKKNVSIERSTIQVEVFDTAVAILASFMIIPAVFAFSGGEADTLKAGPSLMFITMPKIFADMEIGRIMGAMFFVLVLFAAVTSAIALVESAVSTFSDEFGWDRKNATILMTVIMVVLGSLSSLGYGPLASVTVLGMQFLDFFDFITNSVMMPIAALAMCVLITRYTGIEKIEEEVMLDGHPFRRRKVFRFFIRYMCPIFVIIILLSSIGNVLGFVRM